MNLYLLNKIIQDILDQFMDYETGEITEEGAKKLDELGLKKEELIDQMIKAYKNNQMLLDGIDAEIERLKDRSAKLQRSMNSMMRILRPNLTEGEKIVTPEYELKWTTSTKVDGLDNYDPVLEFNSKDSLLRSFITVNIPDPVYKFDKKAIQAELKKAKPNLPIDIFTNQTKNPKIN